MSLFIGIPWRDSGDKHRAESYAAVLHHLGSILPGVAVHSASTDHQPFNLAASRNRLARAAIEDGHDLMLLCDADSILDSASVHAALEDADKDVADDTLRLHLPYHISRSLTPKGRRMVLDGADPYTAPDAGALDWSVGGAMVCRPEAWWFLGGQDERFQGWGGEDTAFACAARTLLSEIVRHSGALHHLWHPIRWSTHDPHYIANFELLQRYDAATNDPEAMWTLINEHQREREIREH